MQAALDKHKKVNFSFLPQYTGDSFYKNPRDFAT